MKIVLPEHVEILSDKHINQLKKLGVIFYNDFPKTDSEIIKRIGDSEIITLKWLKINKNIIKACPNLKYIIGLMIGVENHVDIKAASERNIKVINCPTHNSHAVAEHIFALIFALTRNIVEAQVGIQKGSWRKSPYSFQGTELQGKTLGLVGYGKIAKQVEKIAKAFGMIVNHVNSKSSDDDIDDLIKKSDIINLSLPLIFKTQGLFNKKRISLMKKTAYLINTSKGEIVDQMELFEALLNKRIAGAGLDSFIGEPIIGKATQEIIKLAKLPNIVATPHVGFNTKESALRLGEEFIKNLEAILERKPINIVG